MILYIAFVLVILVLFGIALFDVETATIPHTLTILLLLIGIIYCCLNKDFKIYLTLPIFGFIFISQVALFFIFGENAIGGGDVKILTISTLFLHTLNDIATYCIYFCLFTLFAYAIAKYKKESHIKFGPYMSLSLISTLMSSFYCTLSNIFLLDLIFVLGIFWIDIIFFSNRRIVENVQKNNLIIKK